MSLILSVIWRLIVIFIALFIAIAAAGIFIGFGAISGLYPELLPSNEATVFGNPDVDFWILVVAVIGVGFWSSLKLAGLAVIPVMIAIIITEMMRWQSVIAHLLLGGAAGLFVLISQQSQDFTPSEGTLIVTLATSFVAAFFYWLIAGRSAGNWMKQLPAVSEQNTNGES